MIGKLLDRYMWIVDLVIIAIFATFMAAGVDHFLTGMIDEAIQGALTSGENESPAIAQRPRSRAASTFKPVDGLAILRRNIFDSETGPLDGVPVLPAVLLTDEAEQYGDVDIEGMIPPRCNAPIIIEACYASEQYPDYSFASVNQDSSTKIIQVGDTILNYRVKEITWRYIYLQQQGGGVCYLDIWNEQLPATAVMAALDVQPTTPAEKIAFAQGGPVDAADFQALLNKSIKDLSPTEKDIDRSLIDYLVENKQTLMQSGRVLPNVEGDAINGFKVYGIRKTSLWGMLGIHNGDVVLTVNDMQMDGPDKAYDAFANLQGSDSMTVNVLRHGKPMIFTYNIK